MTDPTTNHIKAKYQPHPHRINADRLINWTLTAIAIAATITLAVLLIAS
jgi:hypothetical protein